MSGWYAGYKATISTIKVFWKWVGDIILALPPWHSHFSKLDIKRSGSDSFSRLRKLSGIEINDKTRCVVGSWRFVEI